METPSSIMYADLKNFGHVSNRDAAAILLSPKATYGGTSMQSRARNERTFLSREVVHAAPGQIPATQFADLSQASLSLSRQIMRNLGSSADAGQLLVEHYGGQAAQAMHDMLRSFLLDATLYENAVDKIRWGDYPSPQVRGQLLLMLYVSTGCLSDPQAAVGLVDDYARRTLDHGLRTAETVVGEDFSSEGTFQRQDVQLGLLRLVGDAVRGSVYPLSQDPQGTVIGALTSGDSDINDVEYDVSGQHLRIWRAQNGEWYAQGMGSTNGTTLVSGDTQEVHCIEPPRARRQLDIEYPPVRISNSDLLCLGSSTRFLVMRIITR